MKTTDKRFTRLLNALEAIAVFVICFAVLYAGENVGLSNNGDFGRALYDNNLEFRDPENEHYLFKENYIMTDAVLSENGKLPEKLMSLWTSNNNEGGVITSNFVPLKLSKTLNFIVNIISGKDEREYSIKWLALIYITLLSCAAWGIFSFFSDKEPTVRITVFAVFAIIFCDAGYILYFNSLYGEPMQYVSLMLLISLGLNMYKKPSVPKAAGFFAALYFFGGAKLANIPYTLILGSLSLSMITLRCDKKYKAAVILICAVSLLSIAGLYKNVPEWMDNETTYQSVFFGILKNDDNPEASLEALGIDKKYAANANTNAFMDEEAYMFPVDTDEFKRDFYDNISKFAIVKFYITHPSRLFANLTESIKSSAYIRPPALGNSEKVLNAVTYKYSLWSTVRAAVKLPFIPAVVFVSLALFTLYAAAANLYCVKMKRGGVA